MALITVNNKKKAGFALGRLSLVIDKLMPYLRVNSISWHLSQIVVCPTWQRLKCSEQCFINQ